MRFGGEFEYIYSVDPEIMQWKILKFALQPLVENAINHGIHGFTTEGIINLDIVRTGEKSLKITLMDNGRGMSKEALKKLFQEKREEMANLSDYLQRFIDFSIVMVIEFGGVLSRKKWWYYNYNEN